MIRAVIDADAIKYAASAAGEKRTIHVVHKTTGRESTFANRTEFYGGAKQDGGVLARINKDRDSPFLIEEFEITDIQTPEPIENVLHLAKTMMAKWIRAVQADTHIGFLGKGDSWRLGASTILEYKGNRKDLLRPVYLDEVAEYLLKNYDIKLVEGLEADDWCGIETYKKPDSILLAIDKDANGCPALVYNPNKPELGIINCDQFGKLYKDAKGKVRGYGRIFMYHQVCSGDSIDNYKANSASKVKWGEASSFKALSVCQNDKEAWAVMKSIYQKLYPQPTTVIGWRGNPIEVDWLYMLNENFTMARMMRWEGDFVEARDVLDRLGML